MNQDSTEKLRLKLSIQQLQRNLKMMSSHTFAFKTKLISIFLLNAACTGKVDLPPAAPEIKTEMTSNSAEAAVPASSAAAQPAQAQPTPQAMEKRTHHHQLQRR